MSVLIKDMEMPKECHGCRWFYFQGISCTEPKYYLDARCELVESGQDWYGKDKRGGWVGESIEHIPGWNGYDSHKHCVEDGTRASQCPLCELPSAQPDVSDTNVGKIDKDTNVPNNDIISRQDAIDALCKMRCGCVLSSCPLTFEEDGTEVCADVRMLMELPPAQQWIPDGLIKRSDAIQAIANHLGIPAQNWMNEAKKWLADVQDVKGGEA